MNQFGYIEGRPIVASPPDSPAVPGQVVATTAAQPGSPPDTRGEKTIMVAQARLAATRAMVGQPNPPLPPRHPWSQVRLQSPLVLTASRSRMDMLSEKIARQNA